MIVGLFHETVGHLGVFVSGKVARKEYSQIVEVLKSIEQLSPGLYLMRIQEERTEGRPTFTVSFEEKRLEDLRRLNKLERRDERPFAVVSAVSELGERAYLMFVRPWLQHLRSEPMAQLGRALHPQRVQHWASSDLNPLMWPFAPLAESVKSVRQPVAPDNPFLALERLGSTAISASWDLVPRPARRRDRVNVLPDLRRPDEPGHPGGGRARDRAGPDRAARVARGPQGA